MLGFSRRGDFNALFHDGVFITQREKRSIPISETSCCNPVYPGSHALVTMYLPMRNLWLNTRTEAVAADDCEDFATVTFSNVKNMTN